MIWLFEILQRLPSSVYMVCAMCQISEFHIIVCVIGSVEKPTKYSNNCVTATHIKRERQAKLGGSINAREVGTSIVLHHHQMPTMTSQPPPPMEVGIHRALSHPHAYDNENQRGLSLQALQSHAKRFKVVA